MGPLQRTGLFTLGIQCHCVLQRHKTFKYGESKLIKSQTKVWLTTANDKHDLIIFEKGKKKKLKKEPKKVEFFGKVFGNRRNIL